MPALALQLNADVLLPVEPGHDGPAARVRLGLRVAELVAAESGFCLNCMGACSYTILE
jgi:hypothetical protein